MRRIQQVQQFLERAALGVSLEVLRDDADDALVDRREADLRLVHQQQPVLRLNDELCGLCRAAGALRRLSSCSSASSCDSIGDSPDAPPAPLPVMRPRTRSTALSTRVRSKGFSR